MSGQDMAVLRMLRNHPEGVTSLDALEAIGVMRLASRVDELRVAGHRITTTMVRVASGKRVARYRLMEPAKPEQLGMFRRPGAHV